MSERSEDQDGKIDKREAARRQLVEAIHLWLEGRDRLVVHTLVMAAFGILNALAEKTVGARHKEFMRGFLSDFGCTRFYELANYLKHADRDADVSIREPIDTENEWRIGLCLMIFRELRGSLTPEMRAFHMMSMMTYPEHFRGRPRSRPGHRSRGTACRFFAKERCGNALAHAQDTSQSHARWRPRSERQPAAEG